MEVEVFDSGDEPYKEWMGNHPKGYVLNTKRNPETTYAVFHRSHCGHIARHGIGHSPDSFTKHQHIKVCADETEELIKWMVENRPKAVAEWMRQAPPNEKSNARRCGTCLPIVEIDEIGLHRYPEEESEPETHEEGSTATVEVNQYERNEAARRTCLEHYGAQCQVCGLRFKERYGEIGEGFIHVHHEVPLSETDGDVEVHPTKDLKPVCPNCHAMLHQESPPLSIKELKERLCAES